MLEQPKTERCDLLEVLLVVKQSFLVADERSKTEQCPRLEVVGEIARSSRCKVLVFETITICKDSASTKTWLNTRPITKPMKGYVITYFKQSF